MAYKQNGAYSFSNDLGITDTTTTPTNQNKITASDGDVTDRFGTSVAVGNGKIVVGAYGDDGSKGSAYIHDLDGSNQIKITVSGAINLDYFSLGGVAVGNGKIVVGASGDDDNGTNSGSAYIFDLDGNQLAKLQPNDAAADDFFGIGVAVGNGRIVVGAWGNDPGGSAYIYDLDGTNETKITASDAASGDGFGRSVAVGNGRIVVGAWYGNSNSGSAYIFDLNGNQLAKITASDAAADDQFGRIVAVGNGRIVVGAQWNDDAGTNSGSAYIFDLDGTQLAKLTASDAAGSDQFGVSVAVGSGRIVVGAPNDDDDGTSSGSAYIFDLNGNQLTKITASDGASNDEFGTSVAVDSGKIVVGVPLDDDRGSSSGSAYIYDTPSQTHYLDILD